MKAVVICKTGPEIGLGHLKRSIRVSAGIERGLGAVTNLFVIGPKSSESSFDALEIMFVAESDSGFEYALPDGSIVDLLLLDLPVRHLPSWVSAYLAGVRSFGGIAVSIDNYELRSQVDMTFIPSFRVPQNVFGPEDDLSVIHGWDCFLLDENTQPISWRPGHRVLALTGGSDATNLGRHWPALLDASLPLTTELNWVTGPFATRPRLPKRPRLKITEHLAPSDLKSLMQCADYAITAYGVSFFELLQLGVPTVVFSPYGKKDCAELDEIHRERLAIVAKDEVDAIEKLSGLMGSHSLAAELASRSPRKFKSPGVNRLCDEIRRLQSQRKREESK